MARKPSPKQDHVQGVLPDDRPIEDVLQDMLPPEDEPPPEPTLEELGLNLDPDRPAVHAQVVFEDEEPPLVVKMTPQMTMKPEAPPSSSTALTRPPVNEGGGKSPLPALIQFHSRITVTSAYQFDGRTALAPDYVDRNWVTVLDGRPALILRDKDNIEQAVVRLGDWILKQDIQNDAGEIEHDKVVAMTNDEFQKYFVKKAS